MFDEASQIGELGAGKQRTDDGDTMPGRLSCEAGLEKERGPYVIEKVCGVVCCTLARNCRDEICAPPPLCKMSRIGLFHFITFHFPRDGSSLTGEVNRELRIGSLVG